MTWLLSAVESCHHRVVADKIISIRKPQDQEEEEEEALAVQRMK